MTGGTITYRLKRTVMQARALRDQQKYLCNKNNWTSKEFTTIDWESHRQALNQHQRKRTILIKYLNNMAPVGKLVNRYDPKYPAGCSSCSEERETQEHMLICPCPKREEWRDKFIKAITTILEDYNIPPQLHSLMLEGL
jgi:hypothetical protein